MNRKETALMSALAIASAIVILTGCMNQPVIPAPTQPAVPTLDLAATVTAQVAPLVATQAALDAASTQVAQAQSSLTAQASSEASSATPTALAEAGKQMATSAVQGSSPVQTPTDTPVPPTALPTRTPGPSPVAGCVPADAALAPVLTRALAGGIDPGCPTGPVMAVNGAVQEYWANADKQDPNTHLRSLMLWREDQHRIYEIRGDDTRASRASVHVYDDTYQDGEPEVPPACATMKAPGGYQTPIRGFGRVWCDNKLAGTTGWPNRDEVAANLRIQPTRDGLLMKVSAPDAGIGYLVAIDLRDGRAVTVTSP